MNKVIKENLKQMEDLRWIRDETPYYLFSCAKCGRWLHVKTTQINKKCLSCRRNHKVESIKSRSEIVNGIIPSVERIKELQHELAQKELGRIPDLRSENDFNTIGMTQNQLSPNEITSKRSNSNSSYSNLFYKALLDLKFPSFPFYILEMLAEDLKIPKMELKILLREFIKAKILIPLPNQQYKINRNENGN